VGLAVVLLFLFLKLIYLLIYLQLVVLLCMSIYIWHQQYMYRHICRYSSWWSAWQRSFRS